MSTGTARVHRRPLGASAGRLSTLLISLAGLFAMHGISDHGTAGPGELTSTHSVHLSMSVPAAAPHAAQPLVAMADPSGSPHSPMGGHDMGLAGLCLAVLVAVLILSSTLWRMHHSTLRAGLAPQPLPNAGTARARAPTPPDQFALSIQRC